MLIAGQFKRTYSKVRYKDPTYKAGYKELIFIPQSIARN